MARKPPAFPDRSTARAANSATGNATESASDSANGWLWFPGRLRPLAVEGAAQLRAPLDLCLPGWSGKLVSNAEQNPPADWDRLLVSPLAPERSPSGNPGFRVHCDLFPGGSFDCGDALEAANALAGALTGRYVAQDPRLLQLHAASVTLGHQGKAGQVLLLGDSQAGKSSLALQLARRGKRLFGDDRLAVRLDGPPTQAIGLGVGPKVRLPLPDKIDSAQRHFIARYQVAEREAVAHLILPPALLAPLGACCPVVALVLLDRRQEAAPPPARPGQLTPLGRAPLLRHLLPKCLAPHLSAPALLAAGRRLAETLPAWRLTYADSSRAAELLIAHFES